MLAVHLLVPGDDLYLVCMSNYLPVIEPFKQVLVVVIVLRWHLLDMRHLHSPLNVVSLISRLRVHL